MRLTNRLLGGNLDPPVELSKSYNELEEISAEDAIALASTTDEDAGWEGVQDAFAAVYALKEGPTALITEQQYTDYMNVKATVRCRVSYAAAAAPWAFFAFRDTARRAGSFWTMLACSPATTPPYATPCANASATWRT